MIHVDLWSGLAAQESSDVSTRARARAREDGTYELDVLNDVYRIDAHARNITRIHAPMPAIPELSPGLAAVMYLVAARDVDLAGEWVSPRELLGGHFFRGPHEIPVGRIVEHFGMDKRSFEIACQRRGGRPEPYADTACSFTLFPRLPVAVLLWLQDEEFPARASMLVDRTADQHLPPDALLAALSVMENALVAAAPV